MTQVGSEMTQWVEALTARPDDLSLLPGTHVLDLIKLINNLLRS